VLQPLYHPVSLPHSFFPFAVELPDPSDFLRRFIPVFSFPVNTPTGPGTSNRTSHEDGDAGHLYSLQSVRRDHVALFLLLSFLAAAYGNFSLSVG